MDFNFIVKNKNYNEESLDIFDLKENEKIISIDETKDFLDILVIASFFKSKSQAMRAGWDRKIPWGFTSYQIGKFKNMLHVFNPAGEEQNNFIFPFIERVSNNSREFHYFEQIRKNYAK